MNIKLAEKNDIDILKQYDKHISQAELENLIRLKRIYIAEENGTFAGWLRYNLFWDNTPFMNMLFVLEKYRGHGIGTQLTAHWEHEMKLVGHSIVMLSTASNEYSQHFYMKLGYRTIGGFMPDGEPYELVLSKKLGENTN